MRSPSLSVSRRVELHNLPSATAVLLIYLLLLFASLFVPLLSPFAKLPVATFTALPGRVATRGRAPWWQVAGAWWGCTGCNVTCTS